eukprot:gb/GFBE01020467.1/.p1 GENE.gb/GFBE01020467.1/~~gb/GFBE01020467.1/.p1  ORF type:complete len:113 (+),score=39.63 gb/GFBE01020467.1/:1-339(+)
MRRALTSLALLVLAALQDAAATESTCRATGQAACGEDEIEAAELEEAEAMKTELLQVKVSSAATFDEPENMQIIPDTEPASVVIDDMGDMPTMLVQTDIELSPKASDDVLSK